MKSLGIIFEARAAAYLRAQGLELIAQNYRCREGEIDLIMSDHSTLVFVEVKQRSSDRFGSAAATVTQKKLSRIYRTAERFLQKHPEFSHMRARFDIVAFQSAGPTPKWLKSVFTPS